jgi:hypothetical protein
MTPATKIKVRKIREIDFSNQEITEEAIPIELGKNLLLAISFSYFPDFNENTFSVRTHVKYSMINQEIPVLSFLTEIIFDVIGLNEVVKSGTKKNELEINNNFLIPLVGVAIGTSRGMLASKTTGKRIGDFPIPILDPQKVLEEINQKPN